MEGKHVNVAIGLSLGSSANSVNSYGRQRNRKDPITDQKYTGARNKHTNNVWLFTLTMADGYQCHAGKNYRQTVSSQAPGNSYLGSRLQLNTEEHFRTTTYEKLRKTWRSRGTAGRLSKKKVKNTNPSTQRTPERLQ
jgi:hypothetical protein